MSHCRTQYATARITSVKKAPSHEILANVDCGIVDFGAGEGSGDYVVTWRRGELRVVLVRMGD